LRENFSLLLTAGLKAGSRFISPGALKQRAIEQFVIPSQSELIKQKKRKKNIRTR
jgi:hypothetical protein